MRISALQKTTLLDFPGCVACTIFLPGCNLRCPFCHNAELVLPTARHISQIEEAELFAFLSKRAGLLDGVCISGGEPTVHPELPEFIEKIRSMGFRVKLDTNGSSPQMLRDLLDRGLLDYIAIDIKNSPERYCETCGGVDILGAVEESASLLMASSVNYEFRTTVCSPLHTVADIQKIGRWICGARQYFLQPFVDSGSLVGRGIEALPEETIRQMQHAVLPDIPNTRIRGI